MIRPHPASDRTSNRILAVFTQLLLALALFVFVGRALAAVQLLYFVVETEIDRIRLDWATGTELENAGFIVLRNEAGGSDPFLYTPIPVIDATSGTPYTFIPARGDDLIGAKYVFVDEDVDIGTRYYYFLQDVDTSNSSDFHGPENAVAGQTNTPTPPATPTKTNTPVKTNTPTPSRTPTRTPLAAPPRTSTPSGSATTAPTAVPPTDTAEPTQTVSAVDVTLTAISVVLTNQPTPTESETPIAVAQASPRPPTATSSITPEVEQQEARVPIPLGRIAMIAAAILMSGALLTAGILFIMRKNP